MDSWIKHDLIKFDQNLKTVTCKQVGLKGQYTGQVNESGQMHGMGRYYWNFGQFFYEGSFVNGKLHGFGR